MRKAVRWIVPAFVGAVLAAVALIIIGAVAGGAKHAASNSTRPPTASAPAIKTKTIAARPIPKRRRTRTPAVSKSGRCGEITVNQHTSCAFARVVVQEYDAHPDASFLARSPVTGLTYTMHCRQAQGVIACDDNSTSTLAFNGPPPAS